MVGHGRHGRLTGYKFCVRSFHGKWLDDVHAGFLWISVVHYITSHTQAPAHIHIHNLQCQESGLTPHAKPGFLHSVFCPLAGFRM